MKRERNVGGSGAGVPGRGSGGGGGRAERREGLTEEIKKNNYKICRNPKKLQKKRKNQKKTYFIF